MPSGGIEGAWLKLNEQKDALEEENVQLKKRCEDFEERLRVYQGTDLAKSLRELEEVKQRVDAGAASLLALNEEETEAMDGVLKAYRIIGETWKLRANEAELTAAVHVIQGFIQQHMLSRLSSAWGSWWWKEA